MNIIIYGWLCVYFKYKKNVFIVENFKNKEKLKIK